jgi:hypothetical protein
MDVYITMNTSQSKAMMINKTARLEIPTGQMIPLNWKLLLLYVQPLHNQLPSLDCHRPRQRSHAGDNVVVSIINLIAALDGDCLGSYRPERHAIRFLEEIVLCQDGIRRLAPRHRHPGWWRGASRPKTAWPC